MNPDLEEALAKHSPDRPTLLSVGIFDGVHIGHQQLVHHLISEAKRRNLLSGVVTFWPHPLAVLQPARAPPQLNDLEDRLARLKALGVDFAVALSFNTELASLEAASFVHLLQKHL